MEADKDEEKPQEEHNDEEEEPKKKVNESLLNINGYILVNEIFSKVNIEQILNPLHNIYVLMFIPKTSELIPLRFEVHFGNQSIMSKVILRQSNSTNLMDLGEDDEEEKKIEKDIKYSPLYIEEAENCFIVHLGKLPGKNRITFKTYFIQPITSADMSYQYIIFNKFPELKIINNYESTYEGKDDYVNIADRDLEKIEIEKINWVMKFQLNSKFTRFVEHLNCKKGYYLRKKFYRDLKRCVFSHTYCTQLPISEFNFFLSGVILFRTKMMNTPLLFKQYSSEFKETYYLLSFMFDKNKMLDSQPSEDNPDEFREIIEIEEDKKQAEKKPRKRTNRGRRPNITPEELEKKKEEENDEFKDFRVFIETTESKLKFEEDIHKAAKKAVMEKKRGKGRSQAKKTPAKTPSKTPSKTPAKSRNARNTKGPKNKIDEFAYDLSDIDMNPDKSYYFNLQEDDIKNSPGLFIFLVDQTFAMQGEGLINLKDSLKKLLAILPKGSYYQLIGFHTFFTMYNETPVEYNQENYLNSMEQIDNMKAEGLTNILDPLFEIYLNGRYNHIELPRFIIMLTDGQVNNTDECLELIEKNNNFFTLHAVGIGENLNQEFIRHAGYVGKGGYDFVKNINDLENVLTNCAYNLMRDYLSDVFLNFIDIVPDITKKIVLKNQDSHFIRQDEIFTMIFNTNDRLTEEALEVIFHYNYRNDKSDHNNDKENKDKNDSRIKFRFCNYNYSGNSKNPENMKLANANFLNYFIRNLPEGNEIGHMFIKNLLLNSDSSISPIYQQENDISTKYQILCKYSEFGITEDFRDKEDKEDYENNKPIYKTGIMIKKNISIESFKLMELSMDYFGLEYNYKMGLGALRMHKDEMDKEDEIEENEDSENKQDKEWYKKKKEILAQTEEINKNVEKLNREEEGGESPSKAKEEKDGKGKKGRPGRKSETKSKSKTKANTRRKGNNKNNDEDKENQDNNKKSKSVPKAKKTEDKKQNPKAGAKNNKPKQKKGKKKKKGDDDLDSDEEEYDFNADDDKEEDEEALMKKLKEEDDAASDDEDGKKSKKKAGKNGGGKKNEKNEKNDKKKKDGKDEDEKEENDGDDELMKSVKEKMLNKKRGRGDGNKKGKEKLKQKIKDKEKKKKNKEDEDDDED